MLSPSPKISVPSSGSRGKEAKGPNPQVPSPAPGPGREHGRVTARMNKPGGSGEQPPAAGLARDGLWLRRAAMCYKGAS